MDRRRRTAEGRALVRCWDRAEDREEDGNAGRGKYGQDRRKGRRLCDEDGGLQEWRSRDMEECWREGGRKVKSCRVRETRRKGERRKRRRRRGGKGAREEER